MTQVARSRPWSASERLHRACHGHAFSGVASFMEMFWHEMTLQQMPHFIAN